MSPITEPIITEEELAYARLLAERAKGNPDKWPKVKAMIASGEMTYSEALEILGEIPPPQRRMGKPSKPEQLHLNLSA